jgi:hypothetical protein
MGFQFGIAVGKKTRGRQRFNGLRELLPLGKVGFHGGCVGDGKVFYSPIQHSSEFFIQGNRKDLLDGLQQSAICDRM